jgi:hypothetical protein
MATFQHSHIDRAPLGDIVSSLIAVLMSESPVDIHYQHRVDERSFELDTEEVRRELGNVPLSHPLVREWLESVLAEGLASLQRLAPQPTRETGRIDFPSNPS